MYEALRSGRIGEYYEALVVSDDELERGRGRGPARRRHAAARRAPRRDRGAPARTPACFPLPTLVEDAEYAVEAAVLGEADVVRLQRRLDELERRLQTVEQRLPRRAYRKLTRTAKRVLGDRATPLRFTARTPTITSYRRSWAASSSGFRSEAASP